MEAFVPGPSSSALLTLVRVQVGPTESVHIHVRLRVEMRIPTVALGVVGSLVYVGQLVSATEIVA